MHLLKNITRNPFRITATLLVIAAMVGAFFISFEKTFESASIPIQTAPAKNFHRQPDVIVVARDYLKTGSSKISHKKVAENVVCIKDQCAAFNKKIIAFARGNNAAKRSLVKLQKYK